MVSDESNNLEYWKAQSYDLESQLFMLYRRNASLSKKIEEGHQERLKLARIIQCRINRVESGKNNDKNKLVDNKNELDMFYTFPEEVWPSILVYLTSSTDLQSLCDASPTLNSVLLNKDKPLWLFDKIFPIIFKQLALTDVLNCRLTCRKWNQATKSYLDIHHAPNKVQNDQLLLVPVCTALSSQFTPAVWENKLDPIDFDRSIHLSTFFADVKVYREAKGENILINRSLKLGPDTDHNNDDIHEFWESVINVLHFVGEDVWHVEIYNDGFEQEPASLYSMFQRTLCCLPKLKTLRLICDFENEDFEREDLVARLGIWPLPCLPYLETLHVLHNLPSPMAATIASSYARQLRKLVVSVAVFIHLEADHLRGFLNLSELVLRNCVRDKEEFYGIFKKLEKLNSPNLEKLRLFRSYSEDEVITTTYLFRLVARVFPRLRVLDTYRIQVEEDSSQVTNNYNNGEISIYSLHTVMIRNSSKLSFDFLLTLPRLAKLRIQSERDRQNERHPPNHHRHHGATQKSDEVQPKLNSTTVDIEQFLYQDKLYKSNVWRLVPSLKVIIYESFKGQIRTSVRYTREMYDFLKK